MTLLSILFVSPNLTIARGLLHDLYNILLFRLMKDAAATATRIAIFMILDGYTQYLDLLQALARTKLLQN